MATVISRRSFMGTATAALLLAGAGIATRGALVGTAFARGDALSSSDDASAADAADALPALHVESAQLVDEEGLPVQLRGVSTHGLAWYPEYVNEACFRQLHDEWGATVVRLALYTDDSGGWCTDGDRDELREVIDRGVQAAVACGLYVIIDWHILSEGDPRTHLEEACDFFDEMSALYGGLPNVLYEICNEPNGSVTWEDVCEYAEEVLPHVRSGAPDAVVLVGTPNWSQQLDDAAAAPLACDDNLMYTLHFYAASHGDDLRATLRSAVEDGLPVFVSEFGICDASGAGAIDEDSADEWVELMDELGVSYVAWNLSNKDEEEEEEEEDEAEAEDDDSSYAEASGAFVTAEGVYVEWARRGAWMSEGRHFGNFDITMTNNTGELIDGWILIVGFGQPVKLVNCWNGRYHECNTRVVAVNEHYNGTLYDGSTTGGIGFIVSAESALEIQNIEVQRA